MKIQTLQRGQTLLEATKCGIYNTLQKFRPDLRDAMEQIPGRDVKASVAFLKNNGMWNHTAEDMLAAFMQSMVTYQRGPDEWSKSEMQKAQENLMCHVASLIRASARNKTAAEE